MKQQYVILKVNKVASVYRLDISTSEFRIIDGKDIRMIDKFTFACVFNLRQANRSLILIESIFSYILGWAVIIYVIRKRISHQFCVLVSDNGNYFTGNSLSSLSKVLRLSFIFKLQPKYSLLNIFHSIYLNREIVLHSK